MSRVLTENFITLIISRSVGGNRFSGKGFPAPVSNRWSRKWRLDAHLETKQDPGRNDMAWLVSENNRFEEQESYTISSQ